jgi:ribokinase
MSGRVVLLGDINLDAILQLVGELPKPGGDGLANRLVTSIGGGICNTAITLRRFGVSAALIACVGQDVWAQAVLPDLEAMGINLMGVQRNPQAATGIAFIAITPDGERTMFSCRGANGLLRAEAIPAVLFDEAVLLQLSAYALLDNSQREALWRAVAMAEERSIPISLDLMSEPARQYAEEVHRLLPRLSLCVLGIEEANFAFRLTEPQTIATYLLERGVRMVGLKLGHNGCLVADQKQFVRLPAFPVQAVDSTGAGDAFCAGLIYGWLRGWDAFLCAGLAAALGALATTTWGAGLGMPGREAALAYLSNLVDRTVDGELRSVTLRLLEAL